MKKLLICIFTIIIFPLLIYYSKDISEGVIEGLKVCFNTIIPSLYVFTVLSVFSINAQVFTELKIVKGFSRLLKLNNNSGCALLLSLFSGYPVGAKLFNELYKKGSLTKKTAELLLCFSINPGPAFVISAIGISIYNNKSLGVILFSSAVISPLILAFLNRKRYTCYIEKSSNNINYTSCFCSSVNTANKTLATICAWVILGSVSVKLLHDVFNVIWLSYFLEISVGVINAAEISVHFVSFLIGFGGISVHLQVLSSAPDIHPRFWLILIYKTVSGLLNSFTTFLLLKVFNVSIATVNINNLEFKNGESTPLASAMLMLFVITTLTFLQRKLKNYGK